MFRRFIGNPSWEGQAAGGGRGQGAPQPDWDGPAAGIKDRQLVEAKAKVVRSQLMEAKSGCSIDLVEADARVVRRQLVEAETRVLHSWWSLRPGWSAAAWEG